MRFGDYTYRVWAWLKHRLTSWNTTGEGIHSPYLFYLVRMLFYDHSRYYSWSEIEGQRRLLLADDQVIDVVDYGTGKSGRRAIFDIASTSMESAACGQLLFRLVAYMSHDLQKALSIVELGTSFGVTTAYLAAACSRNEVVTYEGSCAIAEVAHRVWNNLQLTNIRCVEGNIDDTLFDACTRVDVAYVDANHTREATLSYFNHLMGRVGEHSVLVFDDIHYNREMGVAWEMIKADSRVTTTMDFFHFGLVFVDPHYLKRHYRMRI